MENKVKCKNCGSENAFFGLICRKCKAYLRERVVNIDLWKTIGTLMENPGEAFRLIIHSEHKNFIFFLLLLASVKLFIDGMLLAVWKLGENARLQNFLPNFLIIFSITLFLVFLLSFFLTVYLKKNGIETRLKDNFASMIYSFTPHSTGLLLLFPVELILFGSTLFSVNPSPFAVKETLAYVLLVFELLAILWSIFLLFSALRVQTKNILFSLITSLIINSLLFYSVYLCSIIFFL